MRLERFKERRGVKDTIECEKVSAQLLQRLERGIKQKQATSDAAKKLRESDEIEAASIAGIDEKPD